jgi:hypothetical protein
MCSTDLSDSMADSHSISRRTWQWMEELFFYLLDLTIGNSDLVYKSCGGLMTHLKFREQLVRDLTVLTYKENTEVCGVPRGQPRSSGNQIS